MSTATPAKSTTKKAPARTRNAGSKTVSKGGAGSKRAHSDAQKKVAENAARVEAMNDDTPKSDPKMLTSGPKLEEFYQERLDAAKAEAKLVSAAGWRWNDKSKQYEPKSGGTQQSKPPSPNLDAINAGDKGKKHESSSSTSSKKTTTKRTPKSDGPALAFLVDGQPVAPVHNRLSGISRATGKNNGKKLTTDQLRALLKKNGISEPDTTVWSFELPNGVTISTVEASKAPKRSSKKTSSSKSTSKAA